MQHANVIVTFFHVLGHTFPHDGFFLGIVLRYLKVKPHIRARQRVCLGAVSLDQLVQAKLGGGARIVAWIDTISIFTRMLTNTIKYGAMPMKLITLIIFTTSANSNFARKKLGTYLRLGRALNSKPFEK